MRRARGSVARGRLKIGNELSCEKLIPLSISKIPPNQCHVDSVVYQIDLVSLFMPAFGSTKLSTRGFWGWHHQSCESLGTNETYNSQSYTQRSRHSLIMCYLDSRFCIF